MEEYKKSILEYEDVQDALAYAKDLAREEGLREGLREGREEGLEEGQQKEKIEIAKKCLQKGLAIDDIAELTGLRQEQIESI